MSLKEPIEALAADYQERFGTRVLLQFAGSNALARQIESTRAQDVFFSADQLWMEHLEERGLVESASVSRLLENRLVVAARSDTTIVLDSLDGLTQQAVGHIAIGDPRGVPAGRYAKRSLDQSGLWQALLHKITPGSNVRAALAQAGADPSTVSIVYRTDVPRGDGLRTLFQIPKTLSGPIGYYVAALRRGAAAPLEEPAGDPAALAFIEYCRSSAGTAVFRQYGFTTP